MTFRTQPEAARAEHKHAQLLMLRLVLTRCLQNVMKDGLRADTLLVNHLANAKVRTEELLARVPCVTTTDGAKSTGPSS